MFKSTLDRCRMRPASRRGMVSLTAHGVLLAALVPSVPAVAFTAGGGAAPAAAHYSLPLALQESLYFYDAEKSGPSRTLQDQPLEWRGDSEPTDSHVPLAPTDGKSPGTNLPPALVQRYFNVFNTGGNGTVDLSGGFHDAGDHVKFGLPQSYAASTLGWGVYEFPDAFVATGSYQHALDEMRWFSDYFLRSTFRDPGNGNVIAFNYMVGNGAVDHSYWGPPELQNPRTYPRPATFATATQPASDQTAGAAAALAIEALLVKTSDPAYAARSLDTALALYRFSQQYRGLGNSDGFYNSSSDEDELSWAAVWLYIATGVRQYLNDVIAVDPAGNYTGYLRRILETVQDGWANTWVHSWDTKWGGVFAKLAPLVANDPLVPQQQKDAFLTYFRWNVEYWSHVPHADPNDHSFLPWSPGGFAFLDQWGSARYDAAAQLTALVYRKYYPGDPKSVQFSDWALGQMNYLMGDNPLHRSYIVGFGSTTPVVGPGVGGSAQAVSHPHHRAAQGSLTNNGNDPVDDRHILWGALVGGPDGNDQHQDVTGNYVGNEVAVDYEAGFVGALAGLEHDYGAGQPMTQFTPPPEPPETAYFATAQDQQEQGGRSQFTVTIHNVATHPPHYETDMSLRYFFDISELLAHGQGIGAVSAAVSYDESGAQYGQPAQVSQPVPWNPARGVYYVQVSWNGDLVSDKRDLVLALVEAPDAQGKTYWSPGNDWSYQGLAAGSYVTAPDPYVPVYLGGVRVFGQEPPVAA